MTDDSGEPKLIGQGRYRVRGALGHGAQAETLWAEDTQSSAQVAIKRFQVRGAKSWKDVELAEREANVLARLSHPNLPKYIGHFEEDGALFVVMEKIEGVTLGELREKGALDQALVARFLFDLADTLSYLHGRSPPIVHRDIKPHNVILRPDGRFSLVDFGSVQEKLRPEGGSTVVGTFGYMAPEQFQGRAGPATDVYGAGATAIACLSGMDPEQLPHRGLAIDVQAALGSQLDRSWVQLLSMLVEPDPDKRPRSLRDALGATLASPARSAAPPGPRASSAESYGESREARKRAERRDRHEQAKLERRAAKRERKAARRAARAERREQSPKRRSFPAGLVIFFVLAGFASQRLATLGALLELAPILLCGLAAIFIIGSYRRRAALKAAQAETQQLDPGARADHEWRVSDLLERAQQALEDARHPTQPGAANTPQRLRIDDDPNPSEAERDVVGLEHPPENHRNSRISR